MSKKGFGVRAGRPSRARASVGARRRAVELERREEIAMAEQPRKSDEGTFSEEGLVGRVVWPGL